MDFARGGGGAKAEADRCVSISEQLLAARDLVAGKRFAERALELDPTSSAADRLLAAINILLAAQSPSPSPFSILQLDPASPAAASPSSLSRQFRRLSLLLRSSPPSASSPAVSAAIDAAFTLISQAFSLLSDQAKNKPASPPPPPQPPPATTNSSDPSNSFWTACPSCCCVHEYAADYSNKMLQCAACRSPFRCAELPSAPPIVPGANLYYCSWGFFPIGFPSANDLDNKNWKPFYPIYPWLGNQPPPPAAAPAAPPNNVISSDDPESESDPHPQRQQPATRGRKKMARKKVGNNTKRKVVGSEGGRGVDASGGGGGGISINLEQSNSDDILGNLQNLPFLKEDMMNIHIP